MPAVEKLPKVWPGPLVEKGPRHMLYPYTFTAKLAQFPHLWHYKYNTFFRFYISAVLLLMPTVFYGIHKMSNSEYNVEAWRKIRAHRMHDRWAPVTDDMADDPIYHEKK